MVTGDSSVNPDAPIVCCTAEILANIALRRGRVDDVDTVVMDEFHFYGDRERGWAWQVPLLTAESHPVPPDVGDARGHDADRAGSRQAHGARDCRSSPARSGPCPLHFAYETRPAHEVVQELIDTSEVPVYIVHFSQAAAMERAQALTSVKVITASSATRSLRRSVSSASRRRSGGRCRDLVRAGIGVHHAGLLPRYRRLVENLAQRGLLRVICGTDTLGVGINVPIRTVLITALIEVRRRADAAARRPRVPSDRRAGRPCRVRHVRQRRSRSRPEHDIENAQALRKAGDDQKKRRKITRKKAPDGFVSWSEETFEQDRRRRAGAAAPADADHRRRC